MERRRRGLTRERVVDLVTLLFDATARTITSG
jgi:hypothetical protein